MFKIRDEQLAAFEEDSRSKFVDHLIEYLRGRSPDAAAMDEAGLRRMVEAGIKRAGRHGFDLGPALAAFVTIMFQVAPNFDEHPAIAAILAEKGLTPQDRMNRLRDHISDAQWVEAGSRYDFDAWSAS